ncbi:hypothetical protein MLD38_008167 [Melastoma candidum]|uniref:Uncharacterized protein n=1 Tax=Melastoma candidum TaxID=119954 RepID=A0ACB9RTE6_9MYRT|nr:hypothetical protein MLD38_008167 [Melastoma candidum]
MLPAQPAQMACDGNYYEFRILISQTNNHYSSEDNDDFITSVSDRQMLLIKKQNEELDELSASVKIGGGIGLNIRDELLAQDKIIGDLGSEMDGTTNRLDFVQKKVAIHEEG